MPYNSNIRNYDNDEDNEGYNPVKPNDGYKTNNAYDSHYKDMPVENEDDLHITKSRPTGYDKQYRYPLERQHMVNNPIIFNEDIDLQRRMFWEAAMSTGIVVEFYNCVYDHSDFYQDPNLKWENAIYLPVIFDDHPKVKVLKEYGWFTEDDERPTLVYLPMYRDWTTKELLDVRENSLLRIHYFGQNNASEFRVMDKKMDSLYGVHWICKIAPERFNDFYLVDEHGEHFLKRANRTDECQHEIQHGDIDDDYRQYENGEYVKQITNDHDADDYYDLIMHGGTENTVDNYEENENNDIITKRPKNVIDSNKKYTPKEYNDKLKKDAENDI